MMDAERALLAETVRDAIAAAGGPAAGGAALDAVLAELGWREMLDAEPRDAIDIVFTALGNANGTATVLDDVVMSALGAAPRPDVAVILPRFGTWDPPGRIEADRIDASKIDARGLATGRAATAGELLVVCDAGAGPGAEPCIASVAVSVAAIDAVRGIDPEAGFHRVRVEGAAAAITPLDARAWESAVAAGRRAVAHQMAGASRAMLTLAGAHAVERVQFGRPIARFQAVRHRLAEALVAVEALEAALTAAGDEPNAVTAALAKAVAGRTARTVAAHCQQVLAGIGFTTEHPFHRFLKRAMALEGIFGSADEIAFHLGRGLLASRTVPTLIEL